MISSSTRKAGPFDGNDVTTSFAFTFKVFTTADVEVVLTSIAGVESTLALDTDYSVTLNADQDVSPGGTVTYPLVGVPLATGEKLTLTSNIAETQGTQLPSGGRWDAKVVERALDWLTILVQQVKLLTTRALTYPLSDTTAGSTLPTVTERANQFLAFDASGNPIAAASPAGGTVSVAMQPVVSGASLEAARVAFGLPASWPAIVAKGDMIIGTAAATVGKKSAPANGYLRLADSTQSDGWQDAPLRHFRNRLINGDFRIDQVNAFGLVTTSITSVFGPDMWACWGTLAAGVYTAQAVGTTPPAGFSKYLHCVVTTAAAAPAAADIYNLGTRIEGFNLADLDFGKALAQATTLSFVVRSSLTGSFSGAINNGAANRSYPFSFTINAANTWETKSITIPGDTTGTWPTDSGVGLQLWIDLGNGSSRRGTANAWSAAGPSLLGVTGSVRLISTLSATFDLTGVQLESGSVATAFEFRDFASELARCQRYYEKSFALNTAVAQNAGANTGEHIWPATNVGAVAQIGTLRPYKTRKRAVATVTLYNPQAANAQVRDLSAAADCSGSGTVTTGETGFAPLTTGAAGTVVGGQLRVHWTADARL